MTIKQAPGGAPSGTAAVPRAAAGSGDRSRNGLGETSLARPVVKPMPHWTNRRLYEKARRLRHLEGEPLLVDATGTHRRLHALMANGWRARDLAPRIGWACGELHSLFGRPTVRRHLAATVRALYDELADARGPSRTTARRMQRAGHQPPSCWDDDHIDDPSFNPQEEFFHKCKVLEFIGGKIPDVDPVAVERYLDGDTAVTLNRDEKTVAVVELLDAGCTRTEVARRMRMSGASVKKYAARAADLSYNPTTLAPVSAVLREVNAG